MKSLRVLGIIGIVFSSLSILIMASVQYSDVYKALSWGALGCIYLLALAIVATVQGKNS